MEFPQGQLPDLFNAVNIDLKGSILIAEVQQHLGNNWVRCLALDATEGLARGAKVEDTGKALSVPVGPLTLGRIFNVVGKALDPGEPIPDDVKRMPIHRSAPAYADQETSAQMLERTMALAPSRVLDNNNSNNNNNS